MKANEGKTDRVVRIVLGIILLVVGFILLGSIKVLAIILLILGVIALFTGITGFCALYKVFGMSTCSKCKDES